MSVIDCSKCIHCEVCGDRYASDGYAGECFYFLEYNPSGDLIKEFCNCRNELCLRCGKYEKAYLGACNDCRYNEENMSKYKRERGGAE